MLCCSGKVIVIAKKISHYNSFLNFQRGTMSCDPLTNYPADSHCPAGLSLSDSKMSFLLISLFQIFPFAAFHFHLITLLPPINNTNVITIIIIIFSFYWFTTRHKPLPAFSHTTVIVLHPPSSNVPILCLAFCLPWLLM